MLFYFAIGLFVVYWFIQRWRGKKTADDTKRLLANSAGAVLGVVVCWLLRELVGARTAKIIAVGMILALVVFGLYNYYRDRWYCRRKK